MVCSLHTTCLALHRAVASAPRRRSWSVLTLYRVLACSVLSAALSLVALPAAAGASVGDSPDAQAAATPLPTGAGGPAWTGRRAWGQPGTWGARPYRAQQGGPQRSWQRLGERPELSPRFRPDKSIDEARKARNQPRQDPRYRPLDADEFAALYLPRPAQDPRFRPLDSTTHTPKSASKPGPDAGNPHSGKFDNGSDLSAGKRTTDGYTRGNDAWSAHNQGMGQIKGMNGEWNRNPNPWPLSTPVYSQDPVYGPWTPPPVDPDDYGINPVPGGLGSGLFGAGLLPGPQTPVSPWSYPGPWPIPGFY